MAYPLAHQRWVICTEEEEEGEEGEKEERTLELFNCADFLHFFCGFCFVAFDVFASSAQALFVPSGFFNPFSFA